MSPRERVAAARHATIASAVCFSVVATACTPTLSAPRGRAHLEAMAHGARASHAGRWCEAAQAYARAAHAAERRVDRDEALHRQAHALRRCGATDHAIALLDRIAATRPVSRRTVRAAFDAARLRLEHGEVTVGLRGLERLVLQWPDHGLASRALWLRVRAWLDDGDREAARRWLESLDVTPAVRASSLHDDVLATLAEMAVGEGRRDAARVLLIRIVEEHPYPRGERFDDALWRLADLAESDGSLREAIAWLDRLVSVHETTSNPGSYTLPRHSAAALRIGRLHRRLGEHDRAIDAFARLLEEFPYSLHRDEARLEMAEVHFEIGRSEQACGLLRSLLAAHEVGRARRRAAELHHARCPSPRSARNLRPRVARAGSVLRAPARDSGSNRTHSGCRASIRACRAVAPSPA
ncbi:MAG: tetratricopeptide repeat protein [Myxococcales bacterium]|nr:tetratricopeptide repeat protein [Myxococcales bacterium]